MNQIKVSKPFVYCGIVEVQPGTYNQSQDGTFLIDGKDNRLLINGPMGADYNQFANMVCLFSFKESEVQSLINDGLVDKG